MLRIIDTFPDYLSFWERCRTLPVPEQVEAWADRYMSRWPFLLEKQKKDYRDISEDWREIARDRVFPFLEVRLSSMQEAHDNLLENLESLHETAFHKFEFDEFDVIYVIYVGIGCGAGWVTRILDSQAVLFGLEMISECRWSRSDSVRGLIAHEIGHVIHGKLRQDPELKQEKGPWWQLYTEGYAQRCEHILMNRDSLNERTGLNNPDWLDWCKANKGRLAGKFLHCAENEEDVKPFFGSWYDIQGYKQCGYYLGHEVILELERKYTIRELAKIDDIELTLKPVLESFIDIKELQ